MRNFILTVVFLLMSVASFGQDFKLYKTKNAHTQLLVNTVTGAVSQVQDDGNNWQIVGPIDPNGGYTNRFVLYETENIWNFIELDTFTGRVWQVQFSVDGAENRLCLPINTEILANSRDHSIFVIEPLKSMYQYHLINQETGRMWIFQWSTQGNDYRWMKAIQ